MDLHFPIIKIKKIEWYDKQSIGFFSLLFS